MTSEEIEKLVRDLATIAVLHALMHKDPFPEPQRTIAQAREFADEFIRSRNAD